MYAQSLVRAGRLREALSSIDTGLERLRVCRCSATHLEQTAYIRGRTGIDADYWLRALRPLVLVWLGRFTDADAAIAGMEQRKGELADVRFIPHMAATDMAY